MTSGQAWPRTSTGRTRIYGVDGGRHGDQERTVEDEGPSMGRRRRTTQGDGTTLGAKTGTTGDGVEDC